jgi:hypothetical protein
VTALCPAADDIPARPRSRDADELLVRRAIATALGVPVRRRDTGSGEAVHDLEICYPDGRIGAVEVVSTRDRRAEMLTNAVVQRGHVAVRRLRQSWFVVVPPTTRLRDVDGDLPGFLVTLEAAGIDLVRRGEWGRWRREMDRLGLQMCTSHEPSPTTGPGYRFLPAPRAAFEQRINKAVERCEHFLSERAQRDVIDKLRRADASERHAAPTRLGSTCLIKSAEELPCRPPRRVSRMASTACGYWPCGVVRRAASSGSTHRGRTSW